MEHTGLVAVRLLDTSGGGSGLASGLGGELLTGSLATSGLTCLGCQRLVSERVHASHPVLSFALLMMSHDREQSERK
jgi:hypothetical protein